MSFFSSIWHGFTNTFKPKTPRVPAIPTPPPAGQPATLATSAVQYTAARMRKAGGAYAGGIAVTPAALQEKTKTAGATLLGG